MEAKKWEMINHSHSPEIHVTFPFIDKIQSNKCHLDNSSRFFGAKVRPGSFESKLDQISWSWIISKASELEYPNGNIISQFCAISQFRFKSKGEMLLGHDSATRSIRISFKYYDALFNYLMVKFSQRQVHVFL